jgi:hypothetical protein
VLARREYTEKLTLVVARGILTQDEADTLEVAHLYRNAAYHRDDQNPEALHALAWLVLQPVECLFQIQHHRTSLLLSSFDRISSDIIVAQSLVVTTTHRYRVWLNKPDFHKERCLRFWAEANLSRHIKTNCVYCLPYFPGQPKE